jgi:hypothetical protein
MLMIIIIDPCIYVYIYININIYVKLHIPTSSY